MAKTAEGSGAPLKLPKKQVIHVEGELTVAPRERVKELCSKINPLLKATNGVSAILLMPLPRWPDGPCCSREGHCVGYTGSSTHLGGLVTKLELVRRGVKDQLRMAKIAGVRVANLAKTILSSGGPWSSPVTPNIGAYQALLTKSLEEINSWAMESETATEKERGSDREPGAARKRPLSTSTSRRSAQGRAGSHNSANTTGLFVLEEERRNNSGSNDQGSRDRGSGGRGARGGYWGQHHPHPQGRRSSWNYAQ